MKSVIKVSRVLETRVRKVLTEGLPLRERKGTKALRVLGTKVSRESKETSMTRVRKDLVRKERKVETVLVVKKVLRVPTL